MPEHHEPAGSIICAIAGGSGAGKTTLARKVLERLGDDGGLLAIDWYYRDLSHLTMEERKAVNYDHPDSLEVERYAEDLALLRSGTDVVAPVYDFATHTRTGEVHEVPAQPVIITDGILLLALDEALAHYDHAVFIDVPDDLRRERRIQRDVVERGRDADDIERQWAEFVGPMHDELVEPSKVHAHQIVSADEDLDTVADALAADLRDRAGLGPAPTVGPRRDSDADEELGFGAWVDQMGRGRVIAVAALLVAISVVAGIFLNRSLNSTDLVLVPGSVTEFLTPDCFWRIDYELTNTSDEAQVMVDTFVVSDGDRFAVTQAARDVVIEAGQTLPNTLLYFVDACPTNVEDIRHSTLNIRHTSLSGAKDLARLEF